MKRSTRTYALAGALLILGAPARAQDADEAAMMAAWQAYMTPGEAHQHLAGTAGEWRHEVTVWPAPGVEPMQSAATSTSEMVLGGRYLVETFTGDMMGMPFEGRGTYGYDNAKEQAFMSWIDNMGTGLMVGWGAPEGNKITFAGTFVDPGDGMEKPFRSVVTSVSADHSIMEMYVPAPDGSGEFKNMEIHSYRKTS
jgi:hypothetical protein